MLTLADNGVSSRRDFLRAGAFGLSGGVPTGVLGSAFSSLAELAPFAGDNLRRPFPGDCAESQARMRNVRRKKVIIFIV